MSSNRRWNVIRHLGRAHNGLGMPLNKDDFTSKVYKESASQEPSLSPIAIASSIAASSLTSIQNQKEKYDPFDHLVRPLRRADTVSTSSYAAGNRFNAFGNPAYSQPFCYGQ